MQLSMHDYVRLMGFLLLQFCLFMIEAIKLGQHYQHQDLVYKFWLYLLFSPGLCYLRSLAYLKLCFAALKMLEKVLFYPY